MSLGMCSLIERFSNLILAIEDDEDFDPHWLCFYRIQMAYWILSRSGKCGDLAAALNVYEKIRESWKDVSSYIESGKFDIKDYRGLFGSIDLDFVSQNDTENTRIEYAASN